MKVGEGGRGGGGTRWILLYNTRLNERDYNIKNFHDSGARNFGGGYISSNLFHWFPREYKLRSCRFLKSRGISSRRLKGLKNCKSSSLLQRKKTIKSRVLYNTFSFTLFPYLFIKLSFQLQPYFHSLVSCTYDESFVCTIQIIQYK